MSDTKRFESNYETWSVAKPAVRSSKGMVASQHRLASAIGARVLSEGGNAVDAAVATGLAIGAVEPWMSGLGGGGFMMIHEAASGQTHCVEFGMQASQSLDPTDYPLADAGRDTDLFSWPSVVDDRNVKGPLSIAVPGMVRGHALALERFGSRSWAETIGPALGLARDGMEVDWYATLKIASEAPIISADAECAKTYLPGGFAPAGRWGGPVPRIQLGRLAETYERLRDAGPEDFYVGQLAEMIAADSRALGARVTEADLAAYQPKVTSIEPSTYRDGQVWAASGMSAGPTLLDALHRLSNAWSPAQAAKGPDADAYCAYANALGDAYAYRLEHLGEVDDQVAPGCTTHLSVVDEAGNFVALTQTLLSIFGSKVMLPQTGMLMNNGIMWFDPRPGRPNSMAPGKRPLSNMCPTVARRRDGWTMALGASGGRRIMPAVFQLASFFIDFDMTVDQAVHTPRIDVSGEPVVLTNRKLPKEVIEALSREHDTVSVQHGVHPVLFACPNVVARNLESGESEGGAYINSPWSEVAAQ